MASTAEIARLDLLSSIAMRRAFWPLGVAVALGLAGLMGWGWGYALPLSAVSMGYAVARVVDYGAAVRNFGAAVKERYGDS